MFKTITDLVGLSWQPIGFFFEMHPTLQLPVGKLGRPPLKATSNDPLSLLRLLVTNVAFGLRFLVDTGAFCHCRICFRSMSSASHELAHTVCRQPVSDCNYGKRLLTLNLGLRFFFLWSFLIEDVLQPFLGADFLAHFSRLSHLGKRCLIDATTSLWTPGITTSCPTLSIKLAEHQTPYHALLSQFPTITCSSPFTSTKAHPVTHHIQTENPPVFAKAFRLPPDRLAIAKREFDFMLTQSICHPSNSCWVRPLQGRQKIWWLAPMQRLQAS